MLLETERLLIRPFAPADEPDVIAFFTDPDFMAWSLTGALTVDAAKARHRELMDLYETYGFSKLALAEKGSGRLVGYCGFGRDVIEGTPLPEFGYRLIVKERGQGLATEAARAVLGDAFQRLDMPFVIATVIEENLPSRRVLEKLGMAFQRRILLHERELMLYRLERPEASRRIVGAER